ncbi:MAG: N-acetylmuramoyl-L-alanine amidase [Bacteroidales bacterium]|nr:N-acetylmuramoyl-L-alanine amidase [Bacteroidales bacterium]
MKIFIDNGHGSETVDKRSPDGRFLEYSFNRDIPLTERCRRVNEICRIYGKENVILISIHAYGNGRAWTTPSGWSVYTTKGQTQSDALTEQLAQAAAKKLHANETPYRPSDGDADYEENLHLFRHTLCPAVLTENGFYNNRQGLQFLESRQGRQAIIDLHVEGIIEYIMAL